MPFIMVVLACMAFGWWIGTSRRRNRMRRQTRREIDHSLETGLPSPQTTMGRKAREIAAAEAEKLVSPPPVHGSARWADRFDAEALLDPAWRIGRPSDGLWLGELIDNDRDTGLPLVARYPGHILSVAGTGQGKSATQIVANLLSYKGSVVVLDPKGELYEETAEARRAFGPVWRVAPFGPVGESDSYNPLEELGDPRERGARARQLAEMLIVRTGEKGAANAEYFENEAINLLTALILFVVEITEQSARHKRNLGEVVRLCSLPLLGARKERDPTVKEYLEDVLKLMAEIGKSPMVRRQGALFSGYEPKQLTTFVSEINSNLAFFSDHPGFAEVTGKSDFRFADLAQKTSTVYLTIPLEEMATSFRFLRALIGCAFRALKQQREAKQASLLFILDEFPALKDMPFMRNAVAQMRSSGAWFWFFVQDVAQLEGVYREWSNIFLSQTDHQVFFGATLDQATKTHISTSLGVTTFPYRDPSVSWSHSVGINDSDNAHPTQLPGSGAGRNVGQSVNIGQPVVLAPRALLTPFEVGTYLSTIAPGERHASTTIIFSKMAGGFPVKARRRHWRQFNTHNALILQNA